MLAQAQRNCYRPNNNICYTKIKIHNSFFKIIIITMYAQVLSLLQGKNKKQLGFKVITSFSWAKRATFESKKCFVFLVSLFNERWENILKCWKKERSSAPCWWPLQTCPHSPSLNCSLVKVVYIWVHGFMFCVLCSCRRGRDTKWSNQRGRWWDIRTLLKLRRARSGGTSACMSAGDEHATHRAHVGDIRRWSWRWSRDRRSQERGSCQWFTRGGAAGAPAVVPGTGAPQLGLHRPVHHLWGGWQMKATRGSGTVSCCWGLH